MVQEIFKNKKKSYLSFSLSTLGILVVFLFSINTAYAGSLYISPTSSTVSVGNIITVKVLVNTEGQVINNSDAAIQYPIDLMEVVSIGKNSSIFSVWVEEPRFSNLEGRITFNGGLPNPGYSGQNGEIVSITFKAKKAGTASIIFADSSIRKNDGLGTDILSSKQNATIQIGIAPKVIVPSIDSSISSLPSKPIITSSTHPRQDLWYSGSTATFSWTIPNDVTSIQTLLNKNPNTIPTSIYDGSVSQRTVNNLGDGITYFHMRYMNDIGWGPVAHYKIQVDSTPPEKFSINVERKGSYDVVYLRATDVLSGIESYSIKIDDNKALIVNSDSLINDEYVLPVQNQGSHNLSVVAYDKAGNHTESSASYVSLDITPPTISSSVEEIIKGGKVEIIGNTQYSLSSVDIMFQTEDGDVKTYQAETSSTGSFNLVSHDMKTIGITHIWSQLVFPNNVKSPTSNKITIQVRDNIVIQTSKSVINILFYIIPLLLLIILLIFISYTGWHKFFGLRRKIKVETQDVIDDTHKALMMFKDELGNQLDKLEAVKKDRDLNRKEEKIFKELRDNIEDIDRFIEKKLRKYL